MCRPPSLLPARLDSRRPPHSPPSCSRPASAASRRRPRGSARSSPSTTTLPRTFASASSSSSLRWHSPPTASQGRTNLEAAPSAAGHRRCSGSNRRVYKTLPVKQEEVDASHYANSTHMTQANASSHVHDKMRRTPLSLVLGQGASRMDGRVFKPGVEEQGRANKGVERSGRRPLVCFLFLYRSALTDFSSAGLL